MSVILSCFFSSRKTAEVMRISDWSSDVCSSDLVTCETEPLGEAVELLGRPVLQVTLRCAAATALLAARLVDVHPDGTATRISLGVLNLAHRDGSADTQPMPDGAAVMVTLRLVACGYRDRTRTRLNSRHTCAARMP